MCVYLFFPKTIFRLEMWLWKENHSTFHRLLDDCATGEDTRLFSATACFNGPLTLPVSYQDLFELVIPVE